MQSPFFVKQNYICMSEEKMSLLESIGQRFGFVSKQKEPLILPSIVTQKEDDGAVEIAAAASGVYGHYLDIDGKIGNDFDLISRYRDLALQPEIDFAIGDIVNEAIVIDNDLHPVTINLDDSEYSDKIKDSIIKEFEEIISMLNFNNKGNDIFRQWYVDGRIYYHTMIDEKNPKKGIQEIRNIDPRRIKKIREVKQEKSNSGVKVVTGHEEYYLYSAQGFGPTSSAKSPNTELVKLSPDVISYVTSGITDSNNVTVLSNLHKAIKPMNQLRMLEDSVVIYRLARAPERRIYSIEVGNLPKAKAEEYLASVMNKYRNKMVYDACLDLTTRIPLLDGRTLSLSEIIGEYNSGKELWAYSCDPITGKFAPGIISWAGITRKLESVLKITLDNGESITCTHDHKFPVWEKGKVEARNLIVGDSMIPFSKDINTTEFNNCNISSIEYLAEKMDVGTLTIDREEKYHDYHTFALQVGIYTCNSTGELRDDKRHMSMLEDFFVPKRNGVGTEITTLQPGQNLSALDDVDYFRKKLMKSLNVPYSRLDSEAQWTLGRATEITRDEVRFARFIEKLQNKFSDLFDSILEKQLIFKGIISHDEWKKLKSIIKYRFECDSYFSEMKKMEVIKTRFDLLQTVEAYSPNALAQDASARQAYVSTDWIFKNILQRTEEQIKEDKKEINKEEEQIKKRSEKAENVSTNDGNVVDPSIDSVDDLPADAEKVPTDDIDNIPVDKKPEQKSNSSSRFDRKRKPFQVKGNFKKSTEI